MDNNMKTNTNNSIVNDLINNVKGDKKSLIALAGSLITIIACFLKFVTVSVTFFGTKSESYSLMKMGKFFDNGTDYVGILLILLALATAVLVLFKKQIYTVFTSGFSLLIVIIEFFRVKSHYKDSINKLGKTYEKYISLKWNIGFILILVGIIAVGVSIYLYWKENPDCFNKLINNIKNLTKGNKNNNVINPNNEVNNNNM